MSGATSGGGTRTRLQPFIVGFLALQLLLPLPGLLRDKRDSRGNFSWNMYADTYTCSVLYVVREEGGMIRSLDHRAYFRDGDPTSIFHRDALPAFHAWICESIETRGAGHVEALVTCSANGGPWIDLVEPAAAICTADNHGVN